MTEKNRHCRIFNQSAQYGGHFTLRDTGLIVADLLKEIDQDGPETVLARYADKLTARDIAACRSIAAHHMPERPEYQANGANSALKILFDENMPHSFIPELLNKDARLIHISFNRLTTMADPIIWRFACDKKFNALITNDNDFIRMIEMETLARLQDKGDFAATKIADLPLVIHVASNSYHEGRLNPATIRDNLKEIINQAANPARRVAYNVIDKGTIRPGLTIEEIYHRHMRASLAHIEMLAPIFDRAIMDHNGINCQRQKCGMRLLNFTATPEWKNFHENNFRPTTPRKDSSARPS